MSKSRIIEIVAENNINYGQISRPLDLTLAQEYAHAHVEDVTRDFLIQADAEVSGFTASPTAGLSVNVASGRVYRGGVQFDSPARTLALTPANAALARIDLICAVVSENVTANTEFLAFQRLRTEDEFNNKTPPYPPTQFQRDTESHNTAALYVKIGTPSAAPQPPAPGSNEVALYQITVPAAATALVLANISDVRQVTTNLRAIGTALALTQNSIAELQRQILVLKYRFPTIVSADGRCPATVRQGDDGGYVIDIPVGTLVEFGDRFVYVTTTTSDMTVEARHATASGSPPVAYQKLFEGESIAPTRAEPARTPSSEPPGNVIRLTAPATQKWLYLSYDGALFFRSTPETSHSNQCLLMRITVSGGVPTLKTYRNIRSSVTVYSKVASAGGGVTSRQFELDVAQPVGYLYPYAYAVRAADQTIYSIPTPVITFDGIIDITGVTNGDTWFVNLSTLSAV